MGQLAHYSIDVVARCRVLLDELMPHVREETRMCMKRENP